MNYVIINGIETALDDEEIKFYKPPKYKNFDQYESEYIEKTKPNRSEEYVKR